MSADFSTIVSSFLDFSKKAKAYLVNRYLLRKASRNLSTYQEALGEAIFRTRNDFQPIEEFTQLAEVNTLLATDHKGGKDLLPQQKELRLKIAGHFFHLIEGPDPHPELFRLKERIVDCTNEIARLESELKKAQETGVAPKTTRTLYAGLVFLIVAVIFMNCMGPSDSSFYKRHKCSREQLIQISDYDFEKRNAAFKKLYKRGLKSTLALDNQRILIDRIPRDFIGEIERLVIIDNISGKNANIEVRFSVPLPLAKGNPALIPILENAGQTTRECTDLFGTSYEEARLAIPYTERDFKYYTGLKKKMIFEGKKGWYINYIIQKNGDGTYDCICAVDLYRSIGEFRACHNLIKSKRSYPHLEATSVFTKSEEALFTILKTETHAMLPRDLHEALTLVKEEGVSPQLPTLMRELLVRCNSSLRDKAFMDNLGIMAISAAGLQKNRDFIQSYSNANFLNMGTDTWKRLGVGATRPSGKREQSKIKYSFGKKRNLTKEFSQAVDSAIAYLEPFVEQLEKSAKSQPRRFHSYSEPHDMVKLFHSKLATSWGKYAVAKELFPKAFVSSIYPQKGTRIFLAPIPDGLALRIKRIRFNESIYSITLTPADENAPEWGKGDKRLTRFLPLLARYSWRLLVPRKGNEQISNLATGDVLITTGWISDQVTSPIDESKFQGGIVDCGDIGRPLDDDGIIARSLKERLLIEKLGK